MAPGLSLVDGLSVVTNKSDHRDRLDFDTSGSSFPKEYARVLSRSFLGAITYSITNALKTSVILFIHLGGGLRVANAA